jgi:hypothetical protein
MRRIGFLLVLLFLVSLAPEQPIRLIRVQVVQVYKVFLPVIRIAPKPLTKKGVGMPHGNCEDTVSLKASWEYNWDSDPIMCTVENVPMIWGGSVPSSVSGSSKYLLGMNEPNLSTQSNLTPVAAAREWRQIEQTFPSRRLVSPAPYDGPWYGSSSVLTGLEWLTTFYNTYVSVYGAPPRLDGIAFHCYWNSGDRCVELGRQYASLAQSWGVPELWCTEFAFYPGWSHTPASEVWSREAEIFIEWLESEPLVTHYAWFANRIYGDESWNENPPEFIAPLIDRSGALTVWGQYYRNSN